MATVEQLGQLDLDELEFLQQAVSPQDPSFGMLSEAVKRKRNPALTPDRQAKVNKQYEETKLPEPGMLERANNAVAGPLDWLGKKTGIVPEDSNGTAADSSTLAGTGRNIYKQLNATAAGAINSVPFAGRTMESLGDLEGSYLGSHMLPRPGELSSIEEAAPSPTTAKVSGAVATMTGGLGRLASLPFEAGKALASKVLGKVPGAATVAGGALGGALQGAGDAAIRRVPASIAREPEDPIDWVHEVGAPTAMGGAFAVPGAVAESATHVPAERNPAKPTGGEIARRYATDRARGTQFTPENEKSLQNAIEQSKKSGEERVSEAVRKGRATEDEAAVAAKRSHEDDMARLDAESENEIAKTATAREGELRGRFDESRKGAKGSLEKSLDEIEKETTDPATGKPMAFRTKPYFAKLREFVAEKARQDTANPSGEPQGETHLGVGAEMSNMEAQLKGFLGDEASIRDYRNAIMAFQKKAESGTPLQKYAYTKAISMLRDHLAEVDPTGKVSEANNSYRQEATKRERTRGIVYGKEGEKLGERTPESRFDNPDEDVAGPTITPQEELRGAYFLRKADSPELAPHADELRKYGYGDLLDAIAEAKSSREQFAGEVKRKGEDTLRQKKLESDTKLDKLKRQEQAAVEEDVGDKTGELEDFKTGRQAKEASSWPGLADVAKDVGYGAIGLTIPHHLGSPLTLLHGVKLAQKLAQPLRSRAAYHLPDAEAYGEGLGPSLGAMVSALDSRKGGDKLNLDKLKAKLQELPAEARKRFLSELGITGL
jgi:hypothetical protein